MIADLTGVRTVTDDIQIRDDANPLHPYSDLMDRHERTSMVSIHVCSFRSMTVGADGRSRGLAGSRGRMEAELFGFSLPFRRVDLVAGLSARSRQ
jgi:hypothetical protein